MKKILRLLLVAIIGIWQAQGADLTNVSLSYCGTSQNTLSYKIAPWIETGICYTIVNHSSIPVTVKILFVDGTFTNDEQKNKACLGDTEGKNFWKFVSWYDQIVQIQPGETVKKEAKLLYPLGMIGLFHGCVVYSLIENTNDIDSSNEGLAIIMRKAKFIDVLVGNPKNRQETWIVLASFAHTDGENISSDPQIRIYKDKWDKTYAIQIKVQNVSSVDQDVIITGEISNLLSYKKIFVETRRILKGELLLITKKLEDIPLYNIKTKFTINNTPFSFDTQKPIVGNIQEETNVWIWNIVCYLTIIGILILVISIIFGVHHVKKKKRKHTSKHPIHHHVIHHQKRKK